MIGLDIYNSNSLVAFWLIFTRLVTIMFQMPLFDNKAVPGIVKILFTALITFGFYPVLKTPVMNEIAASGGAFWLLTAYHAGIGLLIGLLVRVIIQIFVGAGSIITQQVGFGAVAYFDPSLAQRVGPFETLINWTIVVTIVMSGALLPMFKGIHGSFFSINFFDLGRFYSSPKFYIDFFRSMFSSALLLSSPILFTNMVLMMVMGIIARTVPQMNILMVSFVVNIGVGLLVFSANAEEFFHTAFRIYVEKLGLWFQFIN